jgi:hypothetical protein
MRLADKPVNPVMSGALAYGMTYREWLAGVALSGILSNPVLVEHLAPEARWWVVKRAANLADQQIAALEKD